MYLSKDSYLFWLCSGFLPIALGFSLHLVKGDGVCMRKHFWNYDRRLRSQNCGVLKNSPYIFITQTTNIKIKTIISCTVVSYLVIVAHKSLETNKLEIKEIMFNMTHNSLPQILKSLILFAIEFVYQIVWTEIFSVQIYQLCTI